MPEDNEQDVENQKVDETGKEKVEEEISEKLGSLIEHNEGDKKLLSMLIADPRVRKIIEADGTGKKLVLVEEQENENIAPTKQEDLPGDIDLEGLSRADFAKTLLKQLGDVVAGTVKSSLSDLSNDIGELKNYVTVQQNNDAVGQVESARKLHKDFDDFQKEMLALSKENPRLSIERLYVLAKAEKGDNVSVKVETERPDSSTARTITRPDRKTALPLGRQGMDVLLEEALGRQDLSVLEL